MAPKTNHKHMKYFKLVILLLVGLSACNTSKETSDSEAVEEVAEEVTTTSVRLEKLWETDTLLTTCESVIYDAGANVLYVSNIAGNPTDKDGNGFISSSLNMKNGASMNFYLPDEGVEIYDLVSTSEKVKSLLDKDDLSNVRKFGEVIFKVPKFSFGSTLHLKDILRK